MPPMLLLLDPSATATKLVAGELSAARTAVCASSDPGARPVPDGYAWARAVPMPHNPPGPLPGLSSNPRPAPSPPTHPTTA